METYFDVITVADVEQALKQMGYMELDYNGQEIQMDGTKFVHYIGEIDTTYEIQVEIVTPIQIKVKDRMVEEKHYCYHGKAIKLDEEWKIVYE